MNMRKLLGVNVPEFEIIDIHAHMNHPAQFLCPGDPDIDGMIAQMDRVGVNRVAIAPNMAINCDSALGNRMVLEAAKKYPSRVIGLGTVNFNHFEDSMKSLEECFSSGYFKGVKLHPDFMNYSVQEEGKMHTVLAFARAHKAFLLSHTDARVFQGHLTLHSHPDWFEPYIRDYPDISFILAHCGLGPEGYKASVRLAKQYDNVYLDTTGFRFSNTWTVDAIARQVGPHKVVFGTDMPFNDIGSAAGRVLLSELPLEWRIQMMGENARRVMKET